MREFQVEEMGKLLKKVENWCEKRQIRVEILVNDWGMAALVRENREYLDPCLGVLLNKQKKDPRMHHKKAVPADWEKIICRPVLSEILKRHVRDQPL